MVCPGQVGAAEMLTVVTMVSEGGLLYVCLVRQLESAGSLRRFGVLVFIWHVKACRRTTCCQCVHDTL